MKFRTLAIGTLACTLTALLALPLAGQAQTRPDYLVRRVPTVPNNQPLSMDMRIADYIRDGWVVVMRTALAGRFTGCVMNQEYLFEDQSRFKCSEKIEREEYAPRVAMMRKADENAYVLFIGDHSYVGRLIWKKGLKLHHYIHLGDRLIGIPHTIPDQRRSIGEVNANNGKLTPLGENRSLFAKSVPELSTLPADPPKPWVSLNPAARDSPRKGAADD